MSRDYTNVHDGSVIYDPHGNVVMDDALVTMDPGCVTTDDSKVLKECIVDGPVQLTKGEVYRIDCHAIDSFNAVPICQGTGTERAMRCRIRE